MEYQFPMEHGRMTCWENGNRVNLSMEMQNDRQGLYKGYLQGERGRMELGTLTPEQNVLRLSRSMPRESLLRCGCWPIKSCGVTMVHAFGSRDLPQGWRKEEAPAERFPNDPILKEAAAEIEQCLVHESRDGFSLAIPYGIKRPFALLPIFCFAKFRMMGGRQYVVYSFDQEGCPR